MIEDDVIIRLHEALTECGIPKDAIVFDRTVDVGTKRPYRADVLVVAKDEKTPQFVIEAKANRKRVVAYDLARQQLAGLSWRCPCFVATSEGDVIFITRIVGAMVPGDKWIRLSEKEKLKELFGDYVVESDKAVALNEAAQQAAGGASLEKFRNGIVCCGTILILVLYLFEMLAGKVISNQLAALVGIVLVLYAASYGIIREFKVGNFGVLSFA